MAERICPDCGQPTQRHAGATYCIECSLKRYQATHDHARRKDKALSKGDYAPAVVIFRDIPDGSRGH